MKEHLSGSASPTERTMAWLRAQGYTVEKVEQRITRRVTRDAFGYQDVQAVGNGFTGVLAVQATEGSNFSERVKKVREEPRALEWLRHGNRIWVVAWTLGGPEGTRKKYRVRGVALVADDGRPRVVDFPEPDGG